MNINKEHTSHEKKIYANVIAKIPILKIFLSEDLINELLKKHPGSKVRILLSFIISIVLFILPSILNLRILNNYHFSYLNISSISSIFSVEIYLLAISVTLFSIILYKVNLSKLQVYSILISFLILIVCYSPVFVKKLKILKYENGPLSFVSPTFKETTDSSLKRINKMVDKKEWKYYIQYLYDTKDFIKLRSSLDTILERQLMKLEFTYSPIEYLDFLVYCRKINPKNSYFNNQIQSIYKLYKSEKEYLYRNKMNYDYRFSNEFNILSGKIDSELTGYDKFKLTELRAELGNRKLKDIVINDYLINYWVQEE